MVSNGNNETVTHYWLTYQWLCLNKDALDMTEFAAVYHIYLCPYGFPFIWFTISHKTTCTFYFNSPVCVCVVTIQRYSNPGNPGNPGSILSLRSGCCHSTVGWEFVTLSALSMQWQEEHTGGRGFPSDSRVEISDFVPSCSSGLEAVRQWDCLNASCSVATGLAVGLSLAAGWLAGSCGLHMLHTELTGVGVDHIQRLARDLCPVTHRASSNPHYWRTGEQVWPPPCHRSPHPPTTTQAYYQPRDT